MVTKNDRSTAAITPASRRRGPHPTANGAAVEQASGTAARQRGSARTKPARITSRRAAAGVRGAIAVCSAAALRGSMRVMARTLGRRWGRRGRRAARVESLVAGWLEALPADESRWLLCEAAAWALAWLARTRRAGGSAGGLLERLAAEGRTALDAVSSRDTRPARFLLVFSRLFADVEACRCLESPARGALEEEIGRLATSHGTIGLPGSAAMLERLVRWSSARSGALAAGRLPWDDATEQRWAAAAAFGLRLLGDEGRWLAAGERLPGRAAAPLVEAAEATASARRLRRTARGLAGRGRKVRDGGLLACDLHDVEAATTVIRSGWKPDAIRILVGYRDATPWLEVAVGDRLLVEGPWQWSVALEGRQLEAEAAWEVAGWESDRKAAFLEIAAPLAGGMRLERQVVLLRRQRIVLLADVVTRGPGMAVTSGAIVCRSVATLAAGLEAEAAAETRELVLFDTKPRCQALPLALPEWRGAGPGSLALTDGGLALEQSGVGRIYAPLWLDCEPARVGAPLTWRQLTVADTRRNLPRHQAAGFRVQAGPRQWLLYRALDVARNRTVLGCNVSSEFLLGRIRRSGEVARTLEIE
jgi:hypothetical protein